MNSFLKYGRGVRLPQTWMAGDEMGQDENLLYACAYPVAKSVLGQLMGANVSEHTGFPVLAQCHAAHTSAPRARAPPRRGVPAGGAGPAASARGASTNALPVPRRGDETPSILRSTASFFRFDNFQELSEMFDRWMGREAKKYSH